MRTASVFVTLITAGCLFYSPASSAFSLDDDADDANARELLACFHPEGANYSREKGEWDCELDAHTQVEKVDCGLRMFSGESTYSGTLFYRGKFTNNSYHMDYTLRLRPRQEGKRHFFEVKVNPGEDTAPFPFVPSAECKLRWWTKVRD